MSINNIRRRQAIIISRSFKWLFRVGGHAVPWWRMLVALAVRAVSSPARFRTWCYRVVFFADGRILRRASEQVLADLRDFSFARTSAFDPDPIIMARRQGRRDVWLRISGYLNLDEAQVQQLMENDDGFGG